MLPFIILLLDLSLLYILHWLLLLKLKVNWNFPKYVINVLPAAGGLDLLSIECNQLIEIINLVVSSYLTNTLLLLLLQNSTKLL